MSLFSRTPARLQPFLGYRNCERLRIGARALRSPPADYAAMGQWRALRTMLTQYASAELAGLRVTLTLCRPDGASREYRANTDREGYVWFDIALDGDWQRDGPTAWEVVTFAWTNSEGAQEIDGHVLVPGRDTRVAVISDIDDTIMESGMAGGLRSIARHWRRVFTRMPQDRIAVPGVDRFYSALSGGPVSTAPVDDAGTTIPAPPRPFFYVSSSPWNLFTYLVAFLRDRGLPLGPLMLRDWGLDRHTLAPGAHAAHKVGAITDIMALYPRFGFALIGDDTQGDLAAFASTVERAPNRVRAVFVRRLAGPLSFEEIEAKTMIEAAGVPLWLGSDYDTGRAFLRAAGLTSDAQATSIVSALETASEPTGA